MVWGIYMILISLHSKWIINEIKFWFIAKWSFAGANNQAIFNQASITFYSLSSVCKLMIKEIGSILLYQNDIAYLSSTDILMERH